MKVASISVYESILQSVKMESSLKQHHRSNLSKPTNNETLHWFKESLENGRASEERFKSEAISFFNLSHENGTMSKAMFKRELLDFTSMHLNTQRNLTREFLKEQGGSGRHSEMPPHDYRGEIENDKERKKMFLKFG